MFGTLRLILALMVVVSHMYPTTSPYHMGVTAVVMFYMITGYLMSFKFDFYLKNTARPIFLFVADRFLRVYPLYFAILSIYVFCLVFWGHILNPKFDLSVWKLLKAYLLIPENYFMFGDGTYPLIPTAFSLALEEQFYFVLPFLLFYKRAIKPTITLSLFIFIICSTVPMWSTVEAWNKLADYGIYRLLPGCFGIFFLGVLLNPNSHLEGRRLLIAIFTSYLLSLILAVGYAYASVPFIVSVTVGVIVGFPIIIFCARKKRIAWDDFLGNASYAIFLLHFLVIWIVERGFGVSKTSMLFPGLVLAPTIFFSFALYYLIEKPCQIYRLKTLRRMVEISPKK